ncbi:MAG: hypothetical protein QF745_07220 [Planctomycetota bacterium]|nr:hypothetical protein [Planctomycetota bacterium]
MRHTNLLIGLVFSSSLISLVSWIATAPDLSLQPFYAPTPSREVINDAAFIKHVKAALNEDVSEPPAEDRARLMKASYVVGYGVNKEYLRRICYETAQ